MLTDTSSNGTIINDLPLKRGQTIPLRAGDTVAFPATAPAQLRQACC